MEKERVCDESRMEEWTFENADMSDAVMHRAKNYVDNWDEMKRNHIGCLFWGPVGTGKSYVAGCIANELLKQEVTVRLELSEVRQGYAILVGEEFSCLEFDMNRDTISWIWRKNRIQEVAYGTLTEENLSKRHQLYAGR